MKKVCVEEGTTWEYEYQYQAGYDEYGKCEGALEQ
jgi:hypothetical protein